METTEIRHVPEQSIQNTGNPLALTVSTQAIKHRMGAIKECLEDVMQEGIHYGEIPGTGKPTMLKPGAELVCAMFQLDPQPDVEIDELGDGHREYRVTGSLYSIATGQRVGGGVGSCSTMEKKYRYRKLDTATEVAAPQSYWDSRNASILAKALKDAGVDVPAEAELGTTKENGSWVIAIKERGENPDIADVYNTCLKMAKKRWLVDATLSATGASALFTQDLEDLPDFDYTPKREPMKTEDAHYHVGVPGLEMRNGVYHYKGEKVSEKEASWLSAADARLSGERADAVPAVADELQARAKKQGNADFTRRVTDLCEGHITAAMAEERAEPDGA